MSSSIMKSIFKWPLSLLILLILLVEMCMYVFVRIMIQIFEGFIGWYQLDKPIRDKLKHAKNYGEFVLLSKKLDGFEPRKSWIRENKSQTFDCKNEKLYKSLAVARRKTDYEQAMDLLGHFFQKHTKEYEKESFYSNTYYYPKEIITKIHFEVKELIEGIKITNSIERDRKIEFFKKVTEDNGETALCFSGGAKLAFFHFGVVNELIKAGLVPKVISGTSGGSILAALLGIRNEEEYNKIETEFEGFSENVWKFDLSQLIRNGHALDYNYIKRKIVGICYGNVTFTEAYRKTGRIINIAVTQLDQIHEPFMLNYRTAGNVCIWSAVLASIALPKILPKAELYCKTDKGKILPYHALGRYWVDGSYRSDVPLKFLREKFNVTYVIVSQANPHVIPFALENEGSSGQPPIHRNGDGIKGGFLFSGMEIFLRTDMLKWIVLLERLGILPLVFGFDLSHLVTQTFSGSVTIYAKPSLLDYIWLLRSASLEEIRLLAERGKRAVWPKLKIITNRIVIEIALKQALKELTCRQ